MTFGFLSAVPGDKTAAEIMTKFCECAIFRARRFSVGRSPNGWSMSIDGAGALTARVIVNRLWQKLFGEGIVRTPNDFGYQGEPPTHPELLDWLAGELIRNGWRIKPIQRLIVESSTYRMATSTIRPNWRPTQTTSFYGAVAQSAWKPRFYATIFLPLLVL